MRNRLSVAASVIDCQRKRTYSGVYIDTLGIGGCNQWTDVGKQLQTTKLYSHQTDMLSSDLVINTLKKMELIDITSLLKEQVTNSNIDHGFCFLFNPHTTAGLTINEGADPAVRDDIINGLQKIVPTEFPFQHLEGNSPAHIMASLMGCSLTLLIENRKIFLGTWQRIFFCEFDGPRRRKIKWHITSNS